jgi:hypothetical protein
LRHTIRITQFLDPSRKNKNSPERLPISIKISLISRAPDRGAKSILSKDQHWETDKIAMFLKAARSSTMKSPKSKRKYRNFRKKSES